MVVASAIIMHTPIVTRHGFLIAHLPTFFYSSISLLQLCSHAKVIPIQPDDRRMEKSKPRRLDGARTYWSPWAKENTGRKFMFRIQALFAVPALAAGLLYAAPSPAQTIVDEWSSVKVPPAPELKQVTLDSKTTAILVMDFVKQTCNSERRPRCV